MARRWMVGVAGLLLAGPAAAHELTCDLGVGLAARAPHGAPALAADGRPLLIAPAARLLDVDAYPALLAFRVVVTNVAGAPSSLTGFDGDPAARAGPAAWIFGTGLAPGFTLPVGRSAERLVVVPVASRAECVALGGEPDVGPACPADPSGGARVLVRFDRGQAECRARFRCGGDRPVLPQWRGARQFGWEGQDTGDGVVLDRSGELHLIGASFDPLAAPAPGLLESVAASVTRDGAVRPERPGSQPGTILASVAVDGVGALTYTGWAWGGAWDGFVRKLARDGAVIWERPLEYIGLVAAGPGGTVSVAELHAWSDLLVTKHGATGDVVWQAEVATPLEDRPTALTVDPEGNTYVVGQVSNPQVPTTSDAFVARIDAGGSVLWTRHVATDDLDVPLSVAVSADGTAAVAGYSVAPTGTTQAWVVAFGRDGAPLWTWRPDPARRIVLASAVAADPAAGFWVGLSTTSAVITVMRLTSDGSELWLRNHGPFGSSITGIALDEAGDAYVVGSTSGDVAGPSAGSYDIFLIRLGPDGYP